jgi:hypothetical protein
LLALSSIFAIPPSQRKKGKTMFQSSIDQLRAELAAMPETAFFEFDQRRASDLQFKLFDIDFFGILAALPRTLDSRSHSFLPMILLSKRTAVRVWDVNFDINTLIVTADLDRGGVRWCRAYPSNKRWETGTYGSRIGPKPEGKEAQIFISKAEVLDIRRLCNLSWGPGRYAVTVISYDWITNTMTTKIDGPDTTEPPRAVPYENAVELANKIGPAATSADALPSYTATARHPELKEVGVAITAPATISAKDGPVPVFGAVRVPVPFAALVQPPAGEAARQDPKVRIPVAILKGKLLLLERDAPVRADIDLTIPVYGDRAPQPGQLVDGFFGLDLKAYSGRPLEPDEYLLYFILGEFVRGPVTISVTD